jgi:HSP20 family protein
MLSLMFRPMLTRKEASLDELFNCFFDHRIFGQSSPWLNASETDSHVTLTIDVPGFKKSDIEIDYMNDQLVVRAKSNDNHNRKEIQKIVDVPNVDIKKSTARLEDGVLTLVLEKSNQSKKQSLKIA